MNPFRGQADLNGDIQRPPDAVVDAVGEMVRQFADPFAFLRELVQNSLDAGATRIDVQLRFDPPERGAAGSLRVSVTDDGHGMNLDTLQRCLLVLFRSSKEGDDSKIGRFGVGFFSVFAAQPDRVVVETGDGTGGWRVELSPDYTYEIATLDPRRGTTVSCALPADRARARALAVRSRESLARWCPHVAAALRFTTVDVFDDADATEVRVDAPFDLDALVRVRVDDPKARAAVVVGVSDRPRVMFFNRGILLHEQASDDPPDVAVMVDSPALHHTLSRDDIKRDEAWQRCMDLARRAAGRPLRDALVRALRDAVAARAAERQRSAAGDPARLAALAACAARPSWKLSADEVTLPLLHALDGGDPSAPVMSVERLRPRGGPRLFAAAPDALTRALSRRGIHVVDTGAAGDDDALQTLFEALAAEAQPAHQRFVVVQPQPDASLPPREAELLAAVATLCERPAAWVHPTGALSGRLAFALDHPHDETLVDVRQRGAFKLTQGRALGLSLAHPTAVAALHASERDPLVAALLLSRAALIELAALDDDGDAALMLRAVTEAVA